MWLVPIIRTAPLGLGSTASLQLQAPGGAADPTCPTVRAITASSHPLLGLITVAVARSPGLCHSVDTSHSHPTLQSPGAWGLGGLLQPSKESSPIQ